MYVKIGKYPDRLRCNLFKRLMERRYGYGQWPETLTRFERAVERLEDVIQTLYTPINYCLDKRTQSVTVKIHPYDTWSMDHTLAHIIVPMLKQLKATKHGAPNVDKDDVPEALWPTAAEEQLYNTTGQTDSHFFARWDWVMDEMIWAWEQKLIDWEEQYYGTWIDDETVEPFGGYFKDPDDDGRRRHQERMTRGFLLFGKYTECLWD